MNEGDQNNGLRTLQLFYAGLMVDAAAGDRAISDAEHKLLVDQTVAASAPVTSPIRTARIELTGHLLDSGLITRLFDLTDEAGGEASVEQLLVAQRHDQPSTARMRISAPSASRLDVIVNRVMPLGASQLSEPTDARLETVTQPGVAPQDFYSTTIYPTDILVDGRSVRVTRIEDELGGGRGGGRGFGGGGGRGDTPPPDGAADVRRPRRVGPDRRTQGAAVDPSDRKRRRPHLAGCGAGKEPDCRRSGTNPHPGPFPPGRGSERKRSSASRIRISSPRSTGS